MKKWIAGIAAVVLAGAATAATFVMGSGTTVERVIDGDTIDVSVKGETKRVRLLNIDTPELGRDGLADECFAREAKERLEELLPAGTTVSLEYDVEPQDRYGRELAGVFKDTSFINEVIVQEGYARAVVFEPNRKFYDRILAAEAKPKNSKSGVFGAGVGCFAPVPEDKAKLEGLQQDSEALDGIDLSDPNRTGEAREVVGRMRRTVDEMRGFIQRDERAGRDQEFFYAAELKEFLDRTETQVEDAEKALEKTEQKEQKRREDEEKRREAERQKAEQERAEQQREAERQRAEQQRVATPEQAPQQAPAVADTYTGCRAYGGNYSLNNVDKNGRRYAKIDCNTKVQIG